MALSNHRYELVRYAMSSRSYPMASKREVSYAVVSCRFSVRPQVAAMCFVLLRFRARPAPSRLLMVYAISASVFVWVRVCW